MSTRRMDWAKKLRELSAIAAPGLQYAQYRKELADQFGLIKAPGYADPFTLKEVFVPPHFSLLTGPSESSSLRQLDYQGVLRLSPRLLLLGQPGTGKTTFLRYLAVLLAEDEIPKPFLNLLTLGHPRGPLDHLVPLFVSLPDFADSAQGLTAHLVQVMARYGFENAHNFLTDKLRGGECLLLLDELDKVRPEDRRRQVAAHIERLVTEFPDNRFVVTTRLDELKTLLPSFTSHVRLLGIAENQVPLLVQKYSGDQPGKQETFLAAVERSQSLRSLATNPWFCAALVTTQEREGQASVRYPWLFQEAVRTLLRGSALSVSMPTAETVLQELGLRLHTARQQCFSHDEFSSVTAEVLAATGEGDLSEETCSAPLLEALLDPARLICSTADGSYAFTYPALQEHLTARVLVAKDQISALLEHLGDPWWEEVVVHVAGLQDDASLLITDLLQAGGQSADNLFLASRCVAESSQVGSELRNRVLDGLLGVFQLEEPERWPVAILAVAGLIGQDVEKTFLTLARDQRPERREQAMWALGRIAAEWSVQPLTAALSDTAWPVRRRAAWALSYIRDERAVQPTLGRLIDLLGDEVEAVQQTVIETLVTMGKSAIRPLIDSLDHPKAGVRSMVVATLVRIGTPAIETLLRTLIKGTPEVRERAEQALIEIGPKAVPYLLEALEDENPELRAKAARLLGIVQAPQAVAPLIERLADRDRGVQDEAMTALSRIGEPAVASLIEGLTDERPGVRDRIADDILYAIGDIAVERLVSAVQDEREERRTLRRRAAEVLGEIGNTHAFPPLREALRSPSWEVRRTVVEALGNIGVRIGGEYVIPDLTVALDDDDEGVRLRAVEALGGFKGDEQARQALKQALFDESGRVRRRVVEARSRWDDEEVMEDLLKALRDREADVRRAAAEQLRRRPDPRVIMPLIRALDDEDAGVREAVGTALREHGALAVEPLIITFYQQEVYISPHSLEEEVSKQKRKTREQREQRWRQSIVYLLGQLRTEVPRDDRRAELAKVSYELVMRDLTPAEMRELAEQLSWWQYGNELVKSFDTLDAFQHYERWLDVAEGQQKLAWIDDVKEWLRPGVHEILLGLRQIAFYAGEFNASLDAEMRRRLLGSTAAEVTRLRALCRKVPRPDGPRRPDVPWPDGPLEKTLDHLDYIVAKEKMEFGRGRAHLKLEVLSREVQVRSSDSPVTIIVRLRNEGDSDAYNLALMLRAPHTSEFQVEGPPQRELNLRSRDKRTLEFAIKVLDTREIELRFELMYSDDERPRVVDVVRVPVRFYPSTQAAVELGPNPYSYGPPIATPEMFYGRKAELAWVRSRIQGADRTNALVLYGQRRTGKTSILLTLKRDAQPENCLFVLIDLHSLSLGSNSISEFLHRLAYHIRCDLEGQEVVHLKSHQLEYEDHADLAFLSFVDQIEGAIGDRILVLMLDEFDTLIKKVKAGVIPVDIYDFIRYLMQHYTRFSLMLVGTLEIERYMRDQHFPLFNSALKYPIGFLDEKSARELIIEPAAKRGLQIPPGAVDKILQITAGHPYFVQVICWELFDRAQQSGIGYVDLTDLYAVLPSVIRNTTSEIRYDYGLLPPEERVVLAALARLTDRETSASFTELRGLLHSHGIIRSKDEMMQALRNLRDRDFVIEDQKDGQMTYRVKVELLKQWLEKDNEFERQLELQIKRPKI